MGQSRAQELSVGFSLTATLYFLAAKLKQHGNGNAAFMVLSAGAANHAYQALRAQAAHWGKRMKTRIAIITATCAASALITTTAPSQDRAEAGKVKQIVVRIHRASKGLVYEIKSYEVTKSDANYWLAEIKLRECKDCQIVPILDDNVELGAITQISEMAINAGFKDIRPFVYWRKTGRMAQIQFGPPIKFTTDAQKIERRSEKP
jgi:hypothetical protein